MLSVSWFFVCGCENYLQWLYNSDWEKERMRKWHWIKSHENWKAKIKYYVSAKIEKHYE